MCPAIAAQHLQRLSLSYHDKRGTTDSTYRIPMTRPPFSGWRRTRSRVVTSAFTLIAMLYVTARIDWVLALVALAVAPRAGCFRWSTAAGSASSRSG